MDFEKIILVVSLVTLCLFLASSYRVSGTRILSDLEDLAMERQLKSINKLPVKSIQRIPNFLREKPKTGDLSKARPSMIGLAKGACPSGTVPIRRTTKEDLLASKLLLNNIHPQATSSFNGSYSAFLQMEEKYYTGIEGNITVYDPPVKEGQTYAQNDNFKQSGCINYVCPGFIQTDKSVYLGARISNISVPNGNLFQLRISLQQDLNYNWWLSFGNNVVGYYPAELLFNLNKPQGIGWGGVAVGTPNGYIPPMESGSFPDGNPLHSSFTNIKYRNQLNETLVPQSPHYQLIIDNPKCYDLKYDGYKNEELGFTFQIGGPGGSCPD
ncbi:protein neprosin [Quercus suber]|uniref:protein neprosin n=1 Tax=Quercus suber TaxID=58331 RepID=UPI0032DF2A40